MNFNKIGSYGLYVLALMFEAVLMNKFRMDGDISFSTSMAIMFGSGYIMYMLLKMATDHE